MSHLGRWLSAQVDGELDGIERDRVLNHLAGCDACRREANALRALKRRMTALGDSSADTAIAGRLIERAKSEPDIVPDVLVGAPWPLPPSVAALRPRASRPHQAWLGWRIMTGAAGTGLVAVGLLAFLLGGGQGATPIPKVSPAVESYWMQHSFDTGNKPATGAVLIQSLLPTIDQHRTHQHKTSRPAHAKARRHHRSP
jgi:anti-sigma factor RsiW